MTVTADDLEAALDSVVGTLKPATDRDWSVPAGTLEWDCWHTGEHIADVLMSYTMQLVARPAGRYARLAASAEKGASAGEVLEFVDATVRILATVVRATPPDVRAWHPLGMADPKGFAAMGCVETLLHGEDIALGLGLTLDVPREVCARVLTRLFPDEASDLAPMDRAPVDPAAVDPAAVDSAAVDSAAVDSAAVDSAAVDSAAVDSAAVDPWDALRWATGRMELPGRPRRGRWRWYAAPLGE